MGSVLVCLCILTLMQAPSNLFVFPSCSGDVLRTREATFCGKLGSCIFGLEHGEIVRGRRRFGCVVGRFDSRATNDRIGDFRVT
jgi:hypothetical protein